MLLLLFFLGDGLASLEASFDVKDGDCPPLSIPAMLERGEPFLEVPSNGDVPLLCPGVAVLL